MGVRIARPGRLATAVVVLAALVSCGRAETTIDRSVGCSQDWDAVLAETEVDVRQLEGSWRPELDAALRSPVAWATVGDGLVQEEPGSGETRGRRLDLSAPWATELLAATGASSLRTPLVTLLAAQDAAASGWQVRAGASEVGTAGASDVTFFATSPDGDQVRPLGVCTETTRVWSGLGSTVEAFDRVVAGDVDGVMADLEVSARAAIEAEQQAIDDAWMALPRHERHASDAPVALRAAYRPVGVDLSEVGELGTGPSLLCTLTPIGWGSCRAPGGTGDPVLASSTDPHARLELALVELDEHDQPVDHVVLGGVELDGTNDRVHVTRLTTELPRSIAEARAAGAPGQDLVALTQG